MATFLRSLKFLKRLSIQSRRLSSLPTYSSSTIRVTNRQLLQLSRAQCALLHKDRNYVTKSAHKAQSHAPNKIDIMLNELDHRVRNYQSIYKSHIDKMLDAVTENGFLNNTQALLLIRCCGDFLCAEKAETRNTLTDLIWNTILDLRVPLDVSHYNALLLVYLENERDFSPVDILLEMNTNKIEPNRVTFQRLIKQYCNKGDISGATKILEHMSEKDMSINENIFNSLIKGHSEAGDIPSAVNVLSIMKNAGIEPSSRTYSELLCVYAKKGDAESIRATFNECRVKDIQLGDKEILDVIYTLAVNQHFDIIDEVYDFAISPTYRPIFSPGLIHFVIRQMISCLNKGCLYNKDAVSYILKLVEKDCIDISYKLLKTLIKPENRENFESGGFFLRKLINSGTSPETLIKYCSLLKEEQLHNNPYELAVINLFTHNQHHVALPIMKKWSETGAEIREHYFFPIFVAHSKDNNLQGLLNTVKTMIFDFKMTLSITTIKEYIVPFLFEDAFTNAQTLVNNHLPFANVAHAIILHLLNQSKARQACDFIHSTNMTYRLGMLVRPLVRALGATKDVTSIASIVHHQYAMAQKSNEVYEDKLTAREFSGSVVTGAVLGLPPYDSQLIIELLKGLRERGVGIDQKAAEQVKRRLGDDMAADIEELLNVLVSEDLETKSIARSDNQRGQKFNRESRKPAEDSPEYKMQLVQQHVRNGEKEAVESLLPQVLQENTKYTAGFCATMTDYFSKKRDVDEATKWLGKLREISPDFKLDKAKILNYAIAFIKANRVDEALEALKNPINDVDTNRNILIEKLLENLYGVCPDRIEEFFELMQTNKFMSFTTTAMLSPIVKGPLKAGDVDKAVEKYKWASEKYKITPCKILLMSRLITNEDAKTLKYVTDLSTKVHGEVNSLIDLAVAFFECNRIHQARKILETPGLRLTREKVRSIIEKYYVYDEARLEGFIQLIGGLYLDMDPFYVLLLKSYGKKDDWQKCLALWTQLQEDNVQPSTAFMEELEKILKQCNQNVPFATTTRETWIDETFSSALLDQNYEKAEQIFNELPLDNQRSRHRIKLAQAYLDLDELDKSLSHVHSALDENHTMAASSEVIVNITEKLVTSDQFDAIAQLFAKLYARSEKNSLPYNKILNEFCLKQGKYSELLSYVEKSLDTSDIRNCSFLFHSTFNTSVLLQHPEYLDSFKKLAFKAIDCDYYSPMNALWSYYFVKDDPEADVIFDKHLKESKYFQARTAIYTCINNGIWDKLPKIVEVVTTCNLSMLIKRSLAFQVLKSIMDSDDSKKYEIAYDCLRQITKFVPIEDIKEEYLTKLKENLPDNLSIESLKSENDRIKEEATG